MIAAKFRRRPGMLYLLIAAACLVTGSLEASGVRRLSLAELVERTEVAAEVFISASRFERDANGYPFTVYLAAVGEQYLGSPRKIVEIWQAGGVDPERGIALTVPGTPQFRIGDRAVVLLYRSKSGKLHVLGGEQGVRTPASPTERLELGARLRSLGAARGKGGQP